MEASELKVEKSPKKKKWKSITFVHYNKDSSKMKDLQTKRNSANTMDTVIILRMNILL